MKKLFFLVALMAGIMATNVNATRTIYLDATMWNVDNPVYAVRVWTQSDADGADYWFTAVSGEAGIFTADIRDDAKYAIFCRKNPNDGEVMNTAFGGAWNRAYAEIPTDKNMFTITAWTGGEGENQSLGSWSNKGQAAPIADVIVKVKKPATWGSIYLWAWDSKDATFMAQFTAWPGVAGKDLGNGWFQVTVKDDAWFKFTSGPGESILESTAAHCVAAHCFTISDQTQKGGMNQDEYILVDADCSAVPTAISNTEVEGVAVKRIVNGQMVIVRDGKTFNALGTEIR